MGVDIAYLHIKRVIRGNEECFLCMLKNEIESKYFDTYLSELVMDALSKEKIIKSRGFYNHHFYKMLIAASKPGSLDGHKIALINKSFIDKLIQDLHEQRSYHIDDLQKLLTAKNKCPAYTHLAEFSRIYAKKIHELLSSNNEKFLKLLKGSKDFCIPHFLLLVQIAEKSMSTQSQKILKLLMEIKEKNLHRLSSEITEYVKGKRGKMLDRTVKRKINAPVIHVLH